MTEATPVAMGEMIAQLHQLARKQEGYGMSFSDPSPRQGGMASINLYGDRAKSAIWLFKNAAVIATALADMQRRVEIFRQIGRWEMAWEIAFQLEQPLIDCTEGKPEQASFDKAAKLVAASIAAKAGRAFSDLPLEVQFGEGEWAEVIEAARQDLSDKTQEKYDG